ncbi:MAG TPA: YdcF family protein [Candidatus Eisenbergiella merdipullorum]|uniref:YdcF family protein n=1 Tax=Candidatus Eisenbergiella merdipullorum TaxID=2838553 RepID=A0A9D2I812_9FIRM|nr:YdcF family protein [Candidatus Eisenbergiella merdipullorum]
MRSALVGLFAAGLLFFLLIEGLIVSRFQAKGEQGLDYLVVLGAQMRENGPSKALKLRLDTAYDYLMENPDTVVVVSGGQGSNEPVSEAQGMYDYLTGRGIAPERIRMEDRSRNTVENLQFSRAFIPKGASVGIVTNNFHVYRAERLAEGQGYGKTEGIAAPCDLFFQANNMIREFFGVMKDWLSGNMKLW